MRTNHADDIGWLRRRASKVQSQDRATALDLAADLLKMHDSQDINIKSWPTALLFVERHIGHRIDENHV